MIAYNQSSGVINLLNIVLQRRSDVAQVEINKTFRRKAHMSIMQVFANSIYLMFTCLMYLSTLCFHFGDISSFVRDTSVV